MGSTATGIALEHDKTSKTRSGPELHPLGTGVSSPRAMAHHGTNERGRARFHRSFPRSRSCFHGPRECVHSTQWNALPEPRPGARIGRAPGPRCALRSRSGTASRSCTSTARPPPCRSPDADETLLQLPLEHDQALATLVAVWQSSLSADPLPVQVPVHWLSLLTHLPLEQFVSATQRHAVFALLSTGVGVSVVVHDGAPGRDARDGARAPACSRDRRRCPCPCSPRSCRCASSGCTCRSRKPTSAMQ